LVGEALKEGKGITLLAGKVGDHFSVSSVLARDLDGKLLVAVDALSARRSWRMTSATFPDLFAKAAITLPLVDFGSGVNGVVHPTAVPRNCGS
jgi:hypothetical protein